jgi:uncharacterized protein
MSDTDPMEQLLAVQAHDTRTTQLQARRRALPERSEAVEVADAIRAADERSEVVEAERHRLDRDQARIDDEVAGLRERSGQADKALYSGSVTNPRELQALQDEVASLGRRIGELEDQELEMMVEREPFDEEASTLAARRAELVARADDVAARLTVAEAEIDAELEAEATARAEAARQVPDDLLAEYEGLRADLDGVGVARLEHGSTCGGCHMKLSAVEADRIKGLPADARIHCEDCGRLLVR